MKTTSKNLILLFISMQLLFCSQFFDNSKGPLKKLLPSLASSTIASSNTQPTVTGSWPVNDMVIVDVNANIIVNFSKDMNHKFTESAFSLRNQTSMDGSFSWNYNSMIFKPQAPLNKTGYYTYTILKSQAESSSGANIPQDYIVRFSYNPDITEPVLISTTPSDGLIGVKPNSKIILKFSKPMNISSVLGSISISPSVTLNMPLTVISENDTKFEFSPTKLLSYGTLYTVSIPNSMKDKSNNALLQSYTISFTVGDDFVSPTLSSITSTTVTNNFVSNQFNIQSGFEKTDSIILQFSEPIKPSTLIGGLTISPGVSFTVNDISGGAQNLFSIQPTSNLGINQIYQINLNTQIADLQNNPLGQTYSYSIQINGPKSSYLQVYNVYSDNLVTPLLSSGINVLVSDGGVGPNYDYAAGANGFYFLFCRGMTLATCDTTSNPRDLTIILSTLQITISYDFGPLVGSPYLTLPTNITPLPLPDLYGFRTTLNSFAPTPTTYIFKIKGGSSGVKDTYGNYMQDDYMLRVRLIP